MSIYYIYWNSNSPTHLKNDLIGVFLFILCKLAILWNRKRLYNDRCSNILILCFDDILILMAHITLRITKCCVNFFLLLVSNNDGSLICWLCLRQSVIISCLNQAWRIPALFISSLKKLKLLSCKSDKI